MARRSGRLVYWGALTLLLGALAPGTRAGTPDFYDRIEPITLRDPLSELLGATADGMVRVRYLDVVHMAGHSCPTVAGAWLMAERALRELYGQALPVRGDIRVEMRDDEAAGVTGVIASVFTQITGAAAEGGFEGLGGRFGRRGLLSFGQPVEGIARFTRTDSGRSVTVRFDHSTVPEDPEIRPLLRQSLAGQASAAESARFRELWALRLERILLHHGEELVSVQISAE